MPIKDIYHEVVKESLIKDGWVITHDPFPLNIGIRTVLVDLGAEKLIAAEKEGKKIAVEIKNFASPSLLNELEKMVGQIRLYRYALSKREPERILFAAVPLRTYNELIQDAELNEFLSLESMNLIIYNHQTGVIEEWIVQ